MREWSVFHFEVDGVTAAAAFVSGQNSRQSSSERQWFAAQKEAWLSVWEVLSVDRGGEFRARDLLSGEERTVRDEKAAESVRLRDAFLARVVQLGNRSELCGVHPRCLSPLAASHVVDAARIRLRLGSQGLASRELLRAVATGRFLIRGWETKVEEQDAAMQNPPRISTTDGETLVICSVMYEFDPAERPKVAAALAAMPQVWPPVADEMRPDREWTYTFFPIDAKPRAAGRAPDHRKILGEAYLRKSELQLVTDSRERCERLTGQLSAAAGQWLREHERAEEDLRELYLRKLRDPAVVGKVRLPKPEVPSPEQIDRMRAYKRDHYRHWLDESFPALEGKTPRQAARLVRGRRQLDLLLRSMENHEGRLPESDRFDFSELRVELGLDP